MKNEISMSGPWVTDDDIEIVIDALRNGWYGNDAYTYVETFESEFAKYHNRRFALMTPNCTTAIHLLLAGLDIGPEDEVIVPECTWIASAAPITYQGATTVFCDIDPNHWCVTPESVAAEITEHTRAVIVVDLFGNMPDMDGLRALCDQKNIYLIEDSAEALGSIYRETRAGKFGIGSVFSFHRTKTLTTGEGGMLLLDDEHLFKRCKFLRDHGRQPGTYFNTEVTFKYMPFNLQAALGYAQFKRIDELVERKRWIWSSYCERLCDLPDIQINPEPDHVFNSVWCTALVFGPSYNLDKETAMARLEQEGVPSRPFFYPLTSLPAYPDREQKARQQHPVSYDISSRGINLSCALNLVESDIDRICNAVRKILGA